MDLIVPILVACVVACGAEPLSEAHRRRSVYGVYADDFAAQYEPVAVAAFPLHAPVPVLRLLSATGAPGGHGLRAAAPGYNQRKRAVTRAPPRDYRDYRDQYVLAAAPEPEYTYSYEDYEQPAAHASSAHSKYTKYSGVGGGGGASGSYEEYEAAAPVVLYARPNSSGGYSYRHKPRPAGAAAAKQQEPVIIRVHKYKVVRD